MLSSSQIRSKEMLEREREYLEKHMKNEVKTYNLSEEELEKLFGKSYKTEISKRETVINVEGHRWVKDMDGKSVRLNAEIIRDDILSGLNKKGVFEKYEGNNNVKSRLYNIAINGLIKDKRITKTMAEYLESESSDGKSLNKFTNSERKIEDKQIETSSDKQNSTQESKERSNQSNALKIKNIEIQGEILSYRIQDKDLSLVSSESTLSLDKNDIGILIGELEQLKEMI